MSNLESVRIQCGRCNEKTTLGEAFNNGQFYCPTCDAKLYIGVMATTRLSRQAQQILATHQEKQE